MIFEMVKILPTNAVRRILLFHHKGVLANIHSAQPWIGRANLHTTLPALHSADEKTYQKPKKAEPLQQGAPDAESEEGASPRLVEFRKKLRETTDIKDLGTQTFSHPAEEKEPLKSWPDGKNPNTGEVGGPRGPEPTRFGDWERKGRVSDF